MVFTAFLLGAQHKRHSVENKQARLLVVSLGKALDGMPQSFCVKQVGLSIYLSWWPRLTKDMQTEHVLIRINRLDGVVVRASASQSVEQGFIPLVDS